jgi:streptogramin lyase
VTINEFPVAPSSTPNSIQAGPDGNVWFLETADSRVLGRITPTGQITDQLFEALPGDIVSFTFGRDGNIWIGGRTNIDELTPQGALLHDYLIPSTLDTFYHVLNITLGPDGNIWYGEGYAASEVIGRLTPDGEITEFPTPFQVDNIIIGPDGNLWFDGQGTGIGRVTPSGNVTMFDPNNSQIVGATRGLTAGPNGNLWMSVPAGNVIEEVNTAGQLVAMFSPPHGAYGTTPGPDGDLWFASNEVGVDYIGTITPQGGITEYPTPTPNSGVGTIVLGPDGNIWFNEYTAGQIGEVVLNHAPTASAGGPYAVAYGGSLTLDASGSSDPDGDALTYSWTVNGHEDAATGVQPTLTWAQLAALGIAPGSSYTVTVTVSDGSNPPVTSAAVSLAAIKADQIISPDWPVRAPGTSRVTLNLSSSSGLPVTYAVTGPADFDSVTNVLTITGLGTVTVTASQAGDSNYNPAPDISTTYAVAPASLCGVLFKDFNEDGFQDFGELGTAGVAVTLTGTDFNGTAVSLPPATTGASGYFQFPDLLPGTYAVSLPGGLTVTKITVGLNGSAPAVVPNATGLAVAEGTVENVVNFGLEPAAGDALHRGQTAGIGFWNNRNGQALIRALDGGSGTQLGGWLAATLPHLFGSAGHDLTQSSNADVASYFQLLFATRGDKLEAQVLATALSVYVTNSTLAGGGYATPYGFTVAAGGGTGLATVNVGSDGAAVDQANGTTMTILDILVAVDRHATQSTAAAGFTLYAGDQATRGLADDLFGRINDLGGI